MVRHRSQRSKEKRLARIKSKRGSARQVVAGGFLSMISWGLRLF